jgi:hypothetical protein
LDRLKNIIDQYGRWQPLSDYVDRVEAYLHSDFSLSLENSKSLLETIAREICDVKGEEIPKTVSTNSILRKAFRSLGYSSDDLVTQVSSALATIGQQMGNLRNEIGTTSHGKTLEEIKDRNSKVDELTREFLIDTTVIIAAFLIRNVENENPRISVEADPLYVENPDFNEYWDSTFGEFNMGDMSFAASEILYHLDIQAYITELRLFQEQQEDEA